MKHATRFKSFAVTIAIAMVLVLCGYVTVSATPILNFDQDSGGGTIAYDGEGGALKGTNIVFETVVGLGTSSNDGVVLDIIGGDLDFTTGNNITEGPNTWWTFNGGGFFKLTGTAIETSTGGTEKKIASGTLLEGHFTGDPANPSVTGNDFFLVLTSFGVDTKNQDLLDFYGITSSDFQFANTEISFSKVSIDKSNNGFSGYVTSADLSNKSIPSIPDPAPAFLLGSACLIGFSGLRRKFKK